MNEAHDPQSQWSTPRRSSDWRSRPEVGRARRWPPATPAWPCWARDAPAAHGAGTRLCVGRVLRGIEGRKIWGGLPLAGNRQRRKGQGCGDREEDEGGERQDIHLLPPLAADANALVRSPAA